MQLHILVKPADDAALGHFLPELKGYIVVLADTVPFDGVIVFALFWITKYAHSFPVMMRALAAHFANYYWGRVAFVAVGAVALGNNYSFAVASLADSQNSCFSWSLHACAIFSGLFKERDRAACR
jgi:hypothetical protein